MNRKSGPPSLFSHLDETTANSSSDDGAANPPVFSSAGSNTAATEDTGATAGSDH